MGARPPFIFFFTNYKSIFTVFAIIMYSWQLEKTTAWAGGSIGPETGWVSWLYWHTKQTIGPSTPSNRSHLHPSHHLPFTSILEHRIYCGMNPVLPPIPGVVKQILPKYVARELHTILTLITVKTSLSNYCSLSRWRKLPKSLQPDDGRMATLHYILIHAYRFSNPVVSMRVFRICIILVYVLRSHASDEIEENFTTIVIEFSVPEVILVPRELFDSHVQFWAVDAFAPCIAFPRIWIRTHLWSDVVRDYCPMLLDRGLWRLYLTRPRTGIRQKRAKIPRPRPNGKNSSMISVALLTRLAITRV